MTAASFLEAPGLKVERDLLEAIATEVAEVEQELQRQMASSVAKVETVGRHTLQAGGKRLRPAMVSLAARASGKPFDVDRCRKIGACMEMIHMATLIHDDVIDHAPTRRGVPTASAVFGNTAAILSGDVLLAKAMVILADDGDLEIIRTTSRMVVQMAEGEVRELEARGRFDLSEQEHLEILRMKTAAFVQCCCQVGGHAAKADAKVLDALSEFGLHLGMAFQIADDLLDYRGAQNDTGKIAAGDFREAQATLPLIRLRPLLTDSESAFVAGKFGNGVTEADLALIGQWMDERGAFESTGAQAREHLDAALQALESLPASPERELLRSVADFVVDRRA